MDDERKGLPSASPWASYELCAGKFQLEQEAKRLGQEAHRQSEDAASGKRIHARLAGEQVELSESEATTAAFLKERGDWQIERIFGTQPYRQLREKRLWLHLDGKPAMSGRFDVVSYTNELALVQDYKTGFRERPAEDNAQLKCLAVLIAVNLPTVKQVVCQIISGPFGCTEVVYDIAALSAAYDDILSTLKAIHAPDAPLVPGVFQCRHCAAAIICQPCRDLFSPPTKFQIARLPLDLIGRPNCSTRSLF